MMGKDKQLNKLLVLIGYVIPVILCYPFGADLDIIATPRTTVHFKDLLGCNHFHGAALNYSSLLIEEGAGVLYVGAREAIYKLDSANISNSNVSLTLEWAASPEQKKQCLSKGKNNQTECYNHVRFLDRYNDTHLYTCGTHAFRPRCAYIDVAQFTFVRFEEGKEKCPYDPNKGYTGFIIDGEMYSASQYEFRSIPDIRRNFPFPNLRTDDSPTTWLMESDFVGSAFLRESINSSIGDDDKLYFFFTERNAEPTAHSSQTKVARVARVCKGDIGGQRTLQRKWTSFLKARLVCSIPDYELQFNILRSVFVLGGSSTHERVFYGIFGLEWRNVKMSAVCQYSFRDVQAAFDGPFMEQQDSKWREYTGKVPDPRPGSCITDQHRSLLINSSRDLPDNTLNFVRRHPVMSKEIKPVGGRPVLLQRNADYTNIAVQQTVGLDGLRYDTLFIGTEEGWLHRAVKIRERNSLYVSAPTGLVQVPLSYCERYTSCFDCVFARDPHCGWDGRLCVEVASYANSSSLIQDVQMGRRGCTNITSDGFVPHRTRTVMAGDDVLLQCEIRSNLATPQWTLNGKQLQGYDIDFGYRTGTDGLLMINAQNQQSGHYRCYAAENDVWVPVRSYIVIVQPVSPRASHSSGYSSVLPERFFTTTTLPTLSPSSGLWSSSILPRRC
ncbi:hypothetical protein DNTS_028985 [Danionella cerebrum]|uniref:Sema domain-containing protein n=1 Tax=Danionella cerebrum TaxID=2873325 RepID=A0A553QLX4_9TELE|nr:hypothetical protein DNTS_028985 [Danionella translucida]